MEERNFFNEGGVSVTNARFIAQGQTYAMSGVTSVKTFRKDPSRVGPIILGVVGLACLAGGGSASAFGIVLILVAGALFVLMKPEFSVLLSSASGEAKALSSKDGDFIGKVVSALNDAIVHRG